MKNKWFSRVIVISIIAIIGLLLTTCDTTNGPGDTTTYRVGFGGGYSSADWISILLPQVGLPPATTPEDLIVMDLSLEVDTFIYIVETGTNASNYYFTGLSEIQLRVKLAEKGVSISDINVVINKLKTDGYVVAGNNSGGPSGYGYVAAKKE